MNSPTTVKVGKKLLKLVVAEPPTRSQPISVAHKLSSDLIKASEEAFKKDELVIRIPTTQKENTSLYKKINFGMMKLGFDQNFDMFDRLYWKTRTWFEAPFIGRFGKNTDVVGVYDKAGNVIGGIVGAKKNNCYYIEALYLNEKHQRKKSTFALFNKMCEKVKDFAQKRDLMFITCDVLKSKPFLQKLYERIGFKETPLIFNNDELFNHLTVLTKEFGKGTLKSAKN